MADFIVRSSLIDKRETLKKRLLECLEIEKELFLPAAQDFYQLEHPSTEDLLHCCRRIIAAAHGVLYSEDWSSSRFIAHLLAPIEAIHREALALEQELLQRGQGALELEERVVDLPSTKTKVYISLYQSNGHDFTQWAAQLASISRHMIARPIYQHEEQVRAMIRSKPSQISEAYAVVGVESQKIFVTDEGFRQDRLGNNLISLLPESITSEDVIAFVYQGNRYVYKDNKLVLIRAMDKFA